MALNCRLGDDRLLLLIHGQLPWTAKLAALSHLVTCPVCRQRRLELEKATVSLARAVRGSTKPAWRPHARPIPAREFLAASVALIALLMMMISYQRNFGKRNNLPRRPDIVSLSEASDGNGHVCKPLAKD